MLYHVLVFTYKFQLLFQPPSECFTRILITYNSYPNCIIKPLADAVNISSTPFCHKVLDYDVVKREKIDVVVVVVVTTNKQHRHTQFDQFYLFLTTT